MLDILKSLMIVCIVSSAIASVCNMVYGISPYGVFIIATIIQFASSWFMSTYFAYKDRLANTQRQTALISQIESEATEAPCAYCGTVNLIPISPDGDNDFKCIGCGETNGVYVNVTVAQKSVPLDSPGYSVSNFDSHLETAKRSIQNSDS